MKILCTDTEFKVAVNKSHLLEYKHRVRDLNQIRGLSISNDVSLSSVNVETLHWNHTTDSVMVSCLLTMTYAYICLLIMINTYSTMCKLFYLFFYKRNVCRQEFIFTTNVLVLYICMQIFLNAVVRFGTSRWVCYYLGWNGFS